MEEDATAPQTAPSAAGQTTAEAAMATAASPVDGSGAAPVMAAGTLAAASSLIQGVPVSTTGSHIQV